MSSNRVTTIIEDSFGFIWVGTNNGLNILDGSSIKIYKDYLNENNGFRGKVVTAILEDDLGNILCGTKENGLNFLNRKNENFVNIYEPLLSNAASKQINSITQLEERQFILGTDKEYITFDLDQSGSISNVELTQINLDDKEFIKEILYINEAIYIATNKRILKELPNGFELIFEHPFINRVKILEDSLWVIARNRIGVFNSSLTKVKWVDYTIPKKFWYGTDFDIDDDNYLWIGSRRGISRLKLSEELDVISIKEIESTVSSFHVYVDKSNNIYVGAGGEQGLVKLDWKQYQYDYISLPSDFNDKYIHSFVQDDNGKYWIGGRNGIFHYDSNAKAFHKFNNGSYQGLNRRITGFVKGENGEIWIGTSDGIAQFNEANNDFDLFAPNNNTSYGFIYHLNLDRDQNLWYLWKDKLSKMDASTKERTTFDNLHLSNIYIDKNNLLWTVSENTEIIAFDISGDKPIKHTSFSLNLPVYDVWGIISDDLERLWIYTKNGIYVFSITEGKIIRHLNEGNVLSNDEIGGIVRDLKGNLWVKQYFTPTICIDPRTFEVLEYSPEWMRLMNGDNNYVGPIHINDDGKVFTDGIGGFFAYHPDDLKIETEPPRVVLNELKVNNEAAYSNYLGTASLEAIEFNHEENSLEIGLKSINPEISQHTQYAYRLLGNSDEWQYIKELDRVVFNTLQPNNYVFQVMSTNDGSVWSDPNSLISFEIFPPWWRTTTALAIYALALFGLVLLIYRVQLNRKLAVAEANKLKEVDDFKNEFYNNITHEFRTPLTVILGLSEKLEKNSGTIIERNAKQLLNLVNGLLEIGQIESNSAKLNVQSHDVIKYTKYCLESFESLAKQKGITLSFTTNKEELILDYDEDKFQLILNNLFSNAIKFTPENGLIEVSVIEHEDIIKIVVRDNGHGIPNDQIDKVFDRYFQASNNKTKDGSGIGLALSRELTRLMNGNLTAFNNPDGGSSFVLTFQSNQELTVAGSMEEVNEELTFFDSDKNVILVVEDNIDVRNYVVDTIEESYEVLKATNGKEGLESALQKVPDLIISDVMMPEMDGYELCEEIKKDKRTNHIPVILLTAKSDLKSKISGIEHGADAYLGKPFNKKELLAQVKNLIEVREQLKKKYAREVGIEDTTITDPFLEKARTLVLKNIDNEDFGINELCYEIGASRTQMHRKLKALTGLSTSIFIREIKLNQAFKMLSTSSSTVSEIAYSVGFSDPNYFSKVFTEKFKESPSALRQKV
ncbi:response regulator [Flavobacteriaceae sp. LMIT009]